MNNVSTEIIIRNLTTSDIDDILSIEEESFNYPWSREGFTACILSPRCYNTGLFTPELTGYLVSMAVVDELHILNIAVKREVRRNGFATLLLHGLLNEYAGTMKHAFLEVRRTNIPAISFYQKEGFKPVGIRKHYYPDGEDAVLMNYTISTEAYV